MAQGEDKHSKTEEPTPKRLEKFREQGKIAQSRDLTAVATLAGVLLLVISYGPSLGRKLTALFRQSFLQLHRGRGNSQEVVWGVLGRLSEYLIDLLAPVVLCAFVVAVATSLAQTRGNISTEKIGFKASTFNLPANLKNILFSASTMQQVGLALAKALALGVGLYLVLRTEIPHLAQIASLSLFSGLRLVGATALKVTLFTLAFTGLLAAVDYWMTARRLHEDMKMTKQEVKDEHKQQQGDPLVRQRMRAQMMQLGRNRMLSEVANADVVVVNPTHYSVALAYNPMVDDAPRVVGKGKDALAAKIRGVARKNQIPIVSNPPVARAIFAVAKVGEPVPAELYEMVAKVLAYLYRITGKIPA